MKKLTLIFVSGILIGCVGCATRNFIHCAFANLDSSIKGNDLIVLDSHSFEVVNIESELLEFKRIRIDDTLHANITGKIYEKTTYVNDTLILPFANIWAKDTKTDCIIETTSNINGEYNVKLSKSQYDLEIQFVGFNSLRIKNLKIGSGETLKLSAILGEGNGKTEYKQNAANSLIELIE